MTALLFDLWLLEDEHPHPHPAPHTPPPGPHKARLVAHELSTHPPQQAASPWPSLGKGRIHFPAFPFPLPTAHTSLSELDYSLLLSHTPSLLGEGSG